nr:MAG TPA: hypothetical protein [Caudoviricetes sp.]
MFKFLTNIQMELGTRKTCLTFLFSERTYFTNWFSLYPFYPFIFYLFFVYTKAFYVYNLALIFQLYSIIFYH